jgi:hypothetical protein
LANIALLGDAALLADIALPGDDALTSLRLGKLFAVQQRPLGN